MTRKETFSINLNNPLVKTSYFGRLRSLGPSGYYLVRVCNRAPSGIAFDADLLPVIPGWQQLVVPYKEGVITEAEYEARYLRCLDGRREEILAAVGDIIRKAGEREPLLLCFEKPPQFCHRHILAGWLRREGLDVEEI